MFTERGADNEARISIREFFRRYPVVLLLAAVTLSADLCYKMMIPLVPLLFAGRGWSKVLAGAAQSGFVLSETALKPITGGLGDRVKRTNLVMLSLAVGMVTPFFYAKAQGPGAFLALRLIDGAGAAALWPAIIALFADATDEKHRATAMSVFTICMLCSLGIGFTLAPLIKATFGDYEHVFATMSLLMVCAMVLTVWSSKRICRAVKAGVDARARAADPATMAQNLKKLLTDWPVLGQLATLIFIAFMQMMGTSMVTHTTFFFLFDELGWEEKDLWYVIPLAGAGIALLALPAGRLADVAGREAAVKVSMSISAVCLGLMAIVREPWTLGVAAAGYGLAFVVGAPAWMALVTRGEWAGLRGAVLGVVTAFQGAGAAIGLFLGPVLYGDGLKIEITIAENTYNLAGRYAPFGACAAILGVCALAAFIGLRPLKQKQDAANDSPAPG
ncbi:MAG TPA: MFS transporter [bacterium]|nr:MFS transporter [bacterium]